MCKESLEQKDKATDLFKLSTRKIIYIQQSQAVSNKGFCGLSPSLFFLLCSKAEHMRVPLYSKLLVLTFSDSKWIMPGGHKQKGLEMGRMGG